VTRKTSSGTKQLKGHGYSIIILAGDGIDLFDNNIDVEVHFDDGRRYMGTVFTYRNIESLFHRYTRTGECRNGLYVWGSDMVVVRDLRDETIAEMVAGLLEEGALDGAFSRVEDEPGLP
jgi:hypothetical protein